jgi:membrane associated rhomboid family serine protease
MKRLFVENPPLPLAACRSCRIIWFEANQFEAVPEGAASTPEQVEALALELLQKDKERRRTKQQEESRFPEVSIRTLPALAGFPVELNASPLSRRPWATWSLTAVIVMVSIFAFANIQKIADEYGFISTQAWRYRGFTFISSFFLHINWLHLAGNMYFLVVFGNRVEEFLGWWRFLILVLLSTLGGDFLHLAVQSHSAIPCVGASGGISGVIVFYAFKFPKARLGMVLRFSWVAVPAWALLILWLLFQFIFAYLQTQGIGNIGALAHLGGAATGVLCWIYWRRLSLQPTRTGLEPEMA